MPGNGSAPMRDRGMFPDWRQPVATNRTIAETANSVIGCLAWSTEFAP